MDGCEILHQRHAGSNPLNSLASNTGVGRRCEACAQQLCGRWSGGLGRGALWFNQCIGDAHQHGPIAWNAGRQWTSWWFEHWVSGSFSEHLAGAALAKCRTAAQAFRRLAEKITHCDSFFRELCGVCSCPHSDGVGFQPSQVVQDFFHPQEIHTTLW